MSEDKVLDAVAASLSYQLASANKREAYEAYNYASARLDMCQIRERLAEMKAQHEPLSSLLNGPLSARDRLYAAAFWVVVGRMP